MADKLGELGPLLYRFANAFSSKVGFLSIIDINNIIIGFQEDKKRAKKKQGKLNLSLSNILTNLVSIRRMLLPPPPPMLPVPVGLRAL